METNISFSNNLVEVSKLPKIQDIKYQKVDKKYLRIMMFNRILFFVVLAASFLIINYIVDDGFHYLLEFFAVWSFLFALVLIFGFLKFQTLAYAIREKDLIFKRGVLILKTTIIPFNRIQHVAINQGPLMRWLRLSNLRIFTAGGSTSDLNIHGLSSDIAESIKIFVTQNISDEKLRESDQEAIESNKNDKLSEGNDGREHKNQNPSEDMALFSDKNESS